ncbi:MAG: hypothetical protein DRI90_04805 [Deltaproteobacteria bacterium]|nr:MAG: hypothetical protein DRI90_04805 [Deltaproteobacteria bacterium]
MRSIAVLPLVYAAFLSGCAAQPAPEPAAPEPVVVSLSDEADSEEAQKTAKDRKLAADVARNAGILGVLEASDGAALADVFGTGGLGVEAESAMGGLTGSTIGEASGTGGFGLTGMGRGGRGTGSGIGLGSVGVIGRGSGAGFGRRGGRLGGPGKKLPRVRLGAATAGSGLDQDIIRRIVRARFGAMRLCYEQRLTKDPKLEGKMVVDVVIAGDGTVASVKAVESTGDSQLDTCVVKAFKAMTFPKPKGGGVVKLKYPIRFSTAGSTAAAPKSQP